MSYKSGDGRIWYQRKKFVPYALLLPYGMTNITDPAGALTAVREPSAATRGKSVVVDIIQGEPGLPEFQIETRLRKTLNLMLALKMCSVNFQCHMGACGRADDYYASEVALHWERARRGDLTGDRTAKIEGDAAPVALTVPWSAEIGPMLIDFEAEFTSAIPIGEIDAITGFAFLDAECLENCSSQADAGENGYLSAGASAGSVIDKGSVWFTTTFGNTWNLTSSEPFAAGEDISSIVVLGSKHNHRVIVARGTTDAAAPAEIAYADVTKMGTTSWVTANVGAVNGQYINKLIWPDYGHLFACTNDGYVYLSTDGGVSWTAMLTTAVNSLNAMGAISYGSNAGTVWVGGDLNTLYQSEDWGGTFSAIIAPTDGVGNDILSLTVTPDGTLIIGNDAGEMYGTFDDGSEWTTLEAQGVTATSVDDIVSWGDSNIWITVTVASVGKVLRSTDGGATFKLWNLNTPDNDGINTLAIVDPNLVFAGGDPHDGTAFLTKTRTQVLGI